MTWFDKTSYIQSFADDLTDLFQNEGWNNFLKYRIYKGQKFGDVRLFRSKGTDGQIRHLGMVHGYDTSASKFNDQRIIFNDTNFGKLGIADGTQVEFQVKILPISDDEPFTLHIDDVPVNEAEYEVDLVTGRVTFDTPPEPGQVVSATYKLAWNAPEPPNRLIFFTFKTVYLQEKKGTTTGITIGNGDGVKIIFKTPSGPIKDGTLKVYLDNNLVDSAEYTVDLETGDITFNTAPSSGKVVSVSYTKIVPGNVALKLADGDGTTTEFYTPSSPIKSGTLKVYIDAQFVDATEYTVDNETGLITFNTAPPLGSEITVDYTSLAGGIPVGTANTTINDYEVDSFNPDDIESLMEAVYQSLVYMIPSPPTVMSFVSTDQFSAAWQRDSYMYYWGQANKDRITGIFRPDAAGGADEAYFSPFYAGKVKLFDQSPRMNMALISGTRDSDEIKYSPGSKLGPVIIDYGAETSNGNDSVLIQQSIGGAYYQKYYLSFFTHDKAIDPLNDGRLNPSKYTDKHHFSRIFIVHPNDGEVGELDDMYACHPKGISQTDDLEVEETVTNEWLGDGNSERKTFDTKRTAQTGTLQVQVDCSAVIEGSDYTYNPDTKTIEFTTPPTAGAKVLASYLYKQKYRYSLPTTPRTPFCIENVSPFAPIGVAILVDNLT
ncbi:DUF2460 domain-containing protein [Bacillus tianshenii]|nr:DUF2460 domain-containing protein [Bacillus tianshenii]